MSHKLITALALIAGTDTAQTTTTATWADKYTAFIHWQTAEALERAGLAAIDSDGDITLTDAGREAARRS